MVPRHCEPTGPVSGGPDDKLRDEAIHTGTPENFFIIFVDRIFTTLIERPFTNVFDANREITGNP